MNHSPELQLDLDGRAPLSPDTVAALNALCDRAEDAAAHADAHAQAHAPVVLTVTGAPTVAPAGPLPLVNKWERALRRLERLDAPTVALVTGDCGGVALEALLATDLRIARPGTRLLPAAGPRGVWPGMALYRLANQIGVAATRRTVLLGTPVTAERAVTLGLLDELAEDPAAALADLAATLTGTGEGPAIRRQLLLDATTTSFEEALGRHLAACDRTLREVAR
ncbi:enoyl-CoA-hydratase DpgB [Kitasatospora sp. LaBMicrA B282]|uniref:enoyl-CoA-hydratase DpgB n=1 Tax=Kitasatospora sp. LaBMicrA B282 TaxID=3420949 RepID=UPI003D0D370C